MTKEGDRIARQMRLTQSSRDQEKHWDKYFEELEKEEEEDEKGEG
jgi:hypothetical protein